jgi:3-isopropylmalate/(R)-2-methylmalate dehydratase small subunit
MQGFQAHTGLVAPFDYVNVDTDQIMPKQFLKRIERTGYGKYLFFDWRFNADGTPNETFVLNRPQYKGASVLVTRKNFGCGSSREHAPWGLADYGFKVIIGPSFADIFYNNCFKNFMLPIILPEAESAALLGKAQTVKGYSITVDLPTQTLSDNAGFTTTFDVDPFRKECLLNGWDDIGLTLRHADQITAFEAR